MTRLPRLPRGLGARGLACARAAVVLVLLGAASAHAAGEKRPRTRPPEPAPAPPQAPLPPLGVDSTQSPPEALSRLPAVPVDPRRRKAVAFDHLVKFGQHVHIHTDEEVRGDVVVWGGDLRLEGEIKGGVVVVGGNIEIGPFGRVGDEAVALGGRVEQAPGALVRGGAVGLSISPRPFAPGADWQRAQRLEPLAGDAMGFGVLFLWSSVVVYAMRRRFERTRTWISALPWRTTAFGFLALTGGLFTIVMCVVLLAITLVGLPLSLLLALLTILLLFVALGFGVARLGEVVCSAFGARTPRAFVRVLVGVVILALPQISADLVRLAGWGTGGALRGLFAALQFLALATGLGALVLSRFGRTAFTPPPVRPAVPVGAAVPAVGALPTV